MSYGFDMGFAQANSLQEAMTIALESRKAGLRTSAHIAMRT